MPQRKSAKKYLRKSARNRAKNIATATEVKNAIKKFKKSLPAENKDEAKTLLSRAYAKLDKAVKRKVVHANKASRQKSRLTKALNKIAPSA